jgi:hypothetical protein
MSIIDRAARRPTGSAATLASGLTLPLFAAALFVSATLVFSLQPMFTKMVLPLLGGTPSVWSVAMVFFQVVLLLGYGYAHLMTRWLDPRAAVAAHVLVVAAASICLPIGIAGGFGPPPADGAALWLVGLIAASIGLPFFAVAANAPLLQAWFSRSGHVQAQDPYFLYGASNLGSFCALLAYPLLIEPMLTLRQQSAAWSVGFAVLAVLIATAGAKLATAMRRTGMPDAAPVGASLRRGLAWRDRLGWMALAFVPSALLVAVTAHISTDIAAAPFLWVVPLSVYLATFVLAFRPGGERLDRAMLMLQPVVAAPLVVGLNWGTRAYWGVAIAVNLGLFLTSAMICHRALYRRRPPAGDLTEFYLWIAAGGALGGVACGLLAPAMFPDLWEYPVLIVLALMCRPGTFDGKAAAWRRDGGAILALAGLAVVPGLLFGIRLPETAELAWMAVLVLLATAIMLSAAHPARLVGLTAFVLILTLVYQPGLVRTETARSFFGIHKVMESADGRFRMLYHGTTIHGAERLRDDAGHAVSGRPEPLTYYYAGGPLSEAIAATRAARGHLAHAAVVGLGTGSLACHAAPREAWRFYEIDPVVVRIARDPEKFRFLSACGAPPEVVLGDARLTLAAAPEQQDLIILDAFSSDAIPAHLLTREALGLYLDRLAPGGVLVFHLSNRYLELASVVAAVAATHDLATYVKLDKSIDAAASARSLRAASLVAVVARREADLGTLPVTPGWYHLEASGGVRPWTDDYSNVLSALWRMFRATR